MKCKVIVAIFGDAESTEKAREGLQKRLIEFALLEKEQFEIISAEEVK